MKTIESRLNRLERSLQITATYYCDCRIFPKSYYIWCMEDYQDMEADKAKPEICPKCGRLIDPKIPRLVVSVHGWENIHRADLQKNE